MDSESPSPAKRLRAAINGNLQLTECVREFKLPRQFPSMVTKVSGDGISERNKLRSHLNTSAITCLSKPPIHTRIVTSPEIPGPFTRKIKLKGKDGRDLGEVNVQDLPQNIQGKTITLAKNVIIKSRETLSPTDKSKGIKLEVLTPANILKSEKPSVPHFSSSLCVDKREKESADIGRDARDKKPRIIDHTQINGEKEPEIIEKKEMSAVMDSQGKPQVLVFLSGRNWHMAKLSTPASARDAQNGKNIVLGKLPSVSNCGKSAILQVKEESPNFAGQETLQNASDKSLASSKISSTNHSSILAEGIAARCKSKSPAAATENGESRPKMEISRISAGVVDSPVSQVSTAAQVQTADRLPLENTKSTTCAGQSFQNNTSLRKDVMVVLPSDIPDSLDGESELRSVIKDVRPANSKISNFQTTKFGEDNKTAKYPASGDICSPRKETKKLAESEKKIEDISNSLNILTKALSTVEDKELRAKALKALMDCGIGMERLMPICPPTEMRPVKDSATQTPVFGVFDPEHFVYVTQENEELERIRPVKRKVAQKIGHIIGNPQSQELSLNALDLPKWVTPNACNELDAMVEAFVGENEGVNEVRNILAHKPTPVFSKLVSQLVEDFQTYKTFDENGLLSLHRAVINDDVRTVSRLLTLFRGEKPDVLTADGQTSLELAIRYEVSPKIIEMLLEAGADPTSSEIGHDSALIIASKKSLPVLKNLISYVKTRKSLDNYDSSGFTALHYCAQNNNKSGVIELTNISADVNVRDRRSGRTPLFHAIENEHIELAQLLLDRGAQPSIANYSGHTVFALVEEGKHYSLTESLNRIAK